MIEGGKHIMKIKLALGLIILFSFLTNIDAKPRVKIFATGGTIAGVQANTETAGYTAGAVSVDDLIKAVPQLKDIAELSGEQVANIGSQTMNNAVWLKLASRLNEAMKDPNTDGAVITHGTDTMEETAYFLSLTVKTDKPIVMVGSMRPSTSISADGPMNLYNAVAIAGDPGAKGKGVLVILNDEIHYAREVEKMNTTQLNTFHSPNRGRAGLVNTGKIKWFNQSTTRHGNQSEFSVNEKTTLPRVEIVYSYANFGRDVIDFLVKQGVKGIILAGVGDGNSTDDALAALTEAAKKGVIVVRDSRVGSGLVVRNMEVDDDKMGFIASEGLNPQKARILIMLGLTKTSDAKQLQSYFYTY